MSERFYVESPIRSNSATLAGREAHHLIHVMRGNVGDEVVLFDGSGAEFSARIVQVQRHEVQLEVLARHPIDRELDLRVVLGVALPKGDRQTWLVEKAVELGIERLVPLETTRSVARPVPRTLAKLRGAIIESSKQCGRNRLMEITEATALIEYVRRAPQSAIRWIAHPSKSPADCPAAPPNAPVNSIFIAVGPEGGFTEQETAAATQAGWQMVHLGPRLLRVETAAIALASLAALHECTSLFRSFDVFKRDPEDPL